MSKKTRFHSRGQDLCKLEHFHVGAKWLCKKEITRAVVTRDELACIDGTWSGMEEKEL